MHLAFAVGAQARKVQPGKVNALFAARAFENMLAVATCNYPAGVPDCNGCSTVFDGVAYAPPGFGAPGEGDAAGERDMCILRAASSSPGASKPGGA